MAKCEICGSTCISAIVISVNDIPHTYDSLECAIFALAPRCANCGEIVVSQGLTSRRDFFCGESCARIDAARAPVSAVG